MKLVFCIHISDRDADARKGLESGYIYVLTLVLGTILPGMYP